MCPLEIAKFTVWRPILAILTLSLLSSCQQQAVPQRLNGPTMGTTYSVQYLPSKGTPSKDSLNQSVQQLLEQINQLMSTYIPDSELSVWNDRTQKQEWYSLSPKTFEVIELALNVATMTEGQYDITVGPLVELWGFGRQKTSHIPEPTVLANTLKTVGFEAINLRAEPPAIRSTPARLIDLSSIAKGYAVDQIAALLEKSDVRNYLVEVGGEMKSGGRKLDDSLWKVAIESPIVNDRKIHKVLELNNIAIATSGNYRNFFEHEGVRYSHIINAQTGWPVKHELASVTVLDQYCANADALATALLAMGLEKGLALANQQNIAALFISKNSESENDQPFVEIQSKRFKALYP